MCLSNGTIYSKQNFGTKLSSQQVVDRLNKFCNACLKDASLTASSASLRLNDADDAVKDLSDAVFSVAEATLPVKSGLPVLKKPKNSRKRKNKWFDKSCFELKREVLMCFGKLTSKINFPLIPLCEVHYFFVIKKAYKKIISKEKEKIF